MEELRGSSRSREQRAMTAHSKFQHSRALNVSKSAAAMVSPFYTSPPSTPSPTHPFFHLDSTSTTSLSHLAPRSHTSPQNAHELQPPETTPQSDVSSASSRHITSQPHEVPIDNVSSRRVSLEQHLQHGDTGREEAMQSFILERFLPAARTVAADRDRPMYSSDRCPITAMSSTIRHSPSTIKGAPVHSKKDPSAVDASRNVTRYRSFSQDDEGYDESVNGEATAKSCGFFCAGFKSAMSRAHNVAHTSAQAALRNRSTATQPSSQGTSSDEEDLRPKVKVMMQGTQKQRGAFRSAPISFSSSTSTVNTIQDALPRCSASLNKSFTRGPGDNAVECLTQFNSRPLLNVCIKCKSSSSLRQIPMKDLPSCDSIASQQSVQTLRCVYPGNTVGVSWDCHDTQQTPEKLHANGFCLRNASNPRVPSENPPSQVVDMKEGLVSHSLCESALRDRDYPEDDELEFYDALSRFDTPISTQSKDPPLQHCKLKSEGAPMSMQTSMSNEHNLIETHLPCIKEGEIWAFDAGPDGHAEVRQRDNAEKSGKECLMVEWNCRSDSQHGNCVCARSLNAAHSSASNLCGKNTPHEYKKSSSSPMLGWPLGISSFQSGTRKALQQESKNSDNECDANTKFQFAKKDEEQQTHDGRCLTNSNMVCTSNEQGTKHCEKCVANARFSPDVLAPPVPPSPTKHCEKCVANTKFSPDVLSPPVPPSPTTCSWLGKALALKASKPSYFTTLQQEEKVVSAQKKLEFALISDGKKEVRWEDVVKGSQMHSEHFSFSEEIRHHHPANQNAMKPLTL